MFTTVEALERGRLARTSTKGRDRYMIIAAVLHAAGSGRKKTAIMMRSYLSSHVFSEYLDMLLGAGLLRGEDGLYFITPKGNTFLQKYEEMEELLAARE